MSGRSRLEIERDRLEAQKELARLTRLQVDLPEMIAAASERLLALSQELYDNAVAEGS